MACCANGFKNTGAPTTEKALQSFKKLVLVPLYKTDGSRNSILNTDTIDSSYVSGKLSAADPNERWFVVGPFTNVEMPTSDSTFETYSDQEQAKTLDGIVSFMGHLLKKSNVYISKLNSFACGQVGIYGVDGDCGSLYGYLESGDTTNLYPIPLNAPSIDAKYIFGSDSVAAKVTLGFQLARLAKVSHIYKLPAGNFSYDLLSPAFKGNIDLKVSAISSITTTGATLEDLSLDYDDNFAGSGSADGDTKVTGAVPADFTVYNTTTSSSVTVLTAPEAPDGTYALTWAAQTSNDVLEISFYKNGKQLEKQTVTIP